MNKKIISFLLFCLFVFNLEAQSNEAIKISGKIDNFNKSQFVLKGKDIKKIIKIDKQTNTFSETLDVKQGHYNLYFKRFLVPVYLSSGDEVKVNIDVKNRTELPKFEGANSSINKYLSEKRKVFSHVLGNANKLFSSDEAIFLNKIDEYKNALVKLAEEASLPKGYLDFEKRNIYYEYVRNANNYPNYHSVMTRNPDFEVSKGFPDLLKSLDVNNAKDYEESFNYRLLLKDYIKKLAEEHKTGDDGVEYMDLVQRLIKSPEIKSNLIYEAAQEGIVFTTRLDEYYKKFIAYSSNIKNDTRITSLYHKLRETQAGKKTPMFTGYKNYKGGTTSLEDLLGKKKYLYIYLWATWCSYCKKEIPLLDDLRKEYSQDDLEFVGISVDVPKNLEKWRKVITSREMGGVQLFAGKPILDLEFAKEYVIKGIPRFILLAPDGTIISPQAPRPSETKKLQEMLQKVGVKRK